MPVKSPVDKYKLINRLNKLRNSRLFEKLSRNFIYWLNIPFLLYMGEIYVRLGFKYKAKLRQITISVSNCIIALRSTLYSICDFVFFSKISEIKKPENEFQARLSLKRSVQ